MRKQTQKKQPLSPIVKGGIVVAIVVTILLVINGISAYRQDQQNKIEAEKARQEQKRKEKPKFKKYNSNIGQDNSSASKSITKKQAGEYIRRDISYGFQLIQKEGLVSSNRLSTKQLSSDQNKSLLKYFDSVQTFNDFNQCVNVSTASGANYYGQNGQNKTSKTSKIGDKYTILGSGVDYSDSAYNQLLYDVNLKYAAGRMRIDTWLKIALDQETGVITKIGLKGIKPNE